MAVVAAVHTSSPNSRQGETDDAYTHVISRLPCRPADLLARALLRKRRAAGAGGSTTGRTAGRLGADLHQHGGDRVSPSRALPKPQSVWAGRPDRVYGCAAGRPPNGRTVVFLHGGSYYGWYWKEQIKALRNEGFRVIVKDRLGWGKSSKPILPYSISLHASNTARVLEHLGISEAAVVGHSIGGQMATRFAFLYPGMTTHLVLVNAVGLTDNRAGRGFRPMSGEIEVDADPQEVYESGVRTDLRRYVNWRPQFMEHLRIRYGQALSGEWPRLRYVRSLGSNLRSIDSVVNDWPHIQTKAMVLGGEEDGPNFPENARRAAESLPNAELVLIPNVGHNPHEEVPEIVNAELIRFLSSDPDEPASEDW